MRLIGLMPARNEDWAIGFTARVALLWVDGLVLLDHASTDDTHAILGALADEYPDRVALMSEAGQQWDEMRHRQAMLERARAWGASHIAIIDADEFAVSRHGFRDVIEHGLPKDHMLYVPGCNLRGGLHRYHASGIWGNRIFATAFRDRPDIHWSGDCYHSREPRADRAWRSHRYVAGGTIHLWGASERRLRAKHALYKITETLRWPEKPRAEIDRMYSWAIYGRPEVPRDTPAHWQFSDVPASWYSGYEAWIERHLRIDAEPWQEAEVRRLIAEHGRERFAGLDLFGVDQ